MTDSRTAFNPSARQTLVEKLEAVILAVCLIQRHPEPEPSVRTAIVEAELVHLAMTGSMDGDALDRDTFDRMAFAIKEWLRQG